MLGSTPNKIQPFPKPAHKATSAAMDATAQALQERLRAAPQLLLLQLVRLVERHGVGGKSFQTYAAEAALVSLAGLGWAKSWDGVWRRRR